ncbi:vWA domain-containing protein [Ferrimonas balearica]|uniref:vWA domain-containing protein n=1 Tax=Ferrimonas balearica TaxID=44012 RepID=UPI001F2C3F03|nr:VWA domain-containing protein [Ferrimonas balearica]MBY6017323.1 VWA domain-containing protein [Halomonas denitrificans]MBY6093599.1 VWA domain-containing protein [Ferrimonas balearica]
MLSLAFPWIWLALPLPWLFKRQRHAQARALRLPDALLANQGLATAPLPHPAWRYLAIVAWLLILLAASRPLWIGEPVAMKREGRDLMLAVDLSGSMQIEDMELGNRVVDRFTMVRHVLSDFIERRDGDRLGLILFADQAYLQAPLTFDRFAVARFLDEAVLGLVGQQTAIGDAIALGVKRFNDLEQSSRVLVLLTDGENNAGRFTPAQAVSLARQSGVKLYTIGIGSAEIRRRGLLGTRTVNPSSDLDQAEKSFIQLSESTGGRYFRARSTEELESIYQELDQLEPLAREQSQWRPQTELFYWPLSAALALLLMLSLRRAYG